MKSSLKLAVVLSLLLPGFSARGATPCSASAVQACFPALTLAAPGGNPGIPRVITWRDTTGASGVAWGTTSAITAANAYVTYNSGSAALQHNVPTGNIFGFLDNGVEHGYIQPAGTTEIFGADSGTVQLASGIADGATAKAVIAQAGTAFATAGAEIFSIQNGLTEKFGFKWDSGLVFNTTIKPAAADYGISQDGSNLIFGAPTGKGFSFNVNGTAQATVSSTGLVGGAGFQNSAVSNNITWVGGGLISGNGGAAKAIKITGAEADGSTAIGVVLNNSTTLSTAGAKLESIQNNASEKAYIDLGGAYAIPGLGGASTPIAAVTNFYNDSSGNGWINVPSGKFFAGSVNANSVFLISGSQGRTLNAVTVEASPTSLNGQIEVSHIAGGSGAPTSPTAGTGCGTSSAPTVNAGSSDSSGDIQVVCGSAGTAGNPYLTITFAHAYSTAPNCVIFPANAQTAGGVVASDEFVSTTTGTLVINCGTGGTCTTNASALRWKYVCQQ